MINTLEEPTQEVKVFHDHLVQRAKNVATSTAQLVLRYCISKDFVLLFSELIFLEETIFSSDI